MNLKKVNKILVHMFLSAWNGVIGQRVRDAGHGYLTYNFVDKLIQVLVKELI